MSVVNLFENAIKKNRLSHLYLLTGKTGINKISTVFDICYLILKDYDNRENLKDLIIENNHSQIHHIKPSGSVIKKEQILSLQEAFAKTSLVDAPRIYIIEDCDLISTSAANSLLKFMEEPENDKVFGFLTTSNQAAVLPTILSRAQVVRLLAKEENIVYNNYRDLGYDDYLVKSISLITKDLAEANTLLMDENLKIVISFIKEYFDNYDNFTVLDLEKINNIIVDRKLYNIFIELLLINYQEILKGSLNQEVFLVEIINDITSKLNSKYLLKNIKLLEEELIKQSAYININLSLDLLVLKLKKEV